MESKAAVARVGEPGFKIETIALDEPRDDEILIKIAGVGLCHTDIAFKQSGQLGPAAVFGHEGSGIVERVGRDVKKVAPGDRVVITFRSCGVCKRCKIGEPAYCHSMPALNYTGVRTDGTKSLSDAAGRIAGNFFAQSSFAQYSLAYERNVVKIPSDVPLELMGPLGCGVQTGFGGVVRSLKAERGSTILILGGGSVGLCAVMGAKVQGCSTVIVLEPVESRRSLALELGATHVIDPKVERDLAAKVREIVPIGVDYAFDTSGIPEVLSATMNCLGPHGTFGIVGICPRGTSLPGDMIQVITYGHTVKGIIEGDSDPDEFIPEMVEHFRSGRLPFDRLIRTYPLSEINKAIDEQHRGDCVKAVLLPD